MPSEILRSQLSSLSEGIQSTILMIKNETLIQEEARDRESLISQYQRQERKEHGLLLNRKLIIEARKEKIENIRNAQVKFYKMVAKDFINFISIKMVIIRFVLFARMIKTFLSIKILILKCECIWMIFFSATTRTRKGQPTTREIEES